MSQNKQSSESLKCPPTYFEWCLFFTHRFINTLYTARSIVDFPVDINKVWRRLPTELNVQHNFNVFNRDVESWLFSHLCLYNTAFLLYLYPTFLFSSFLLSTLIVGVNLHRALNTRCRFFNLSLISEIYIH